MTPRGYECITRELAWIHQVERPKIVAEVAYAASLGDRSDNAEYRYGKRRLAHLDSRTRFLLKRLGNAQMVDPTSISGEVVRFGATVVLESETGEQRTWRLYGEDEVDVAGGTLSYRSPIGHALLGKTPGDEVIVQAPAGIRRYEILSVAYLPCEPLPDDLDFSR